ncbi:6117_t:CDS:2 [Funneliformis geosporum]|nr:6117_t:CDS:2 [Funneliformis geosporum]
MVDLVDYFKGGININDTCLDPCAGSGTFLLAFLRKQAEKTQNIERAKENLLDTSKLPQLPNIGLMNPPFSKKKKRQEGKAVSQAEILFVERLLDNLQRGGFASTITIISSFDNQKENQTVKKRIYKNHTLKAIINMPLNLFAPSNKVYTQIMVWQAKCPHDYQKDVYFYDLTDDETFRYQKLGNNKFFSANNLTAYDEWTFIIGEYFLYQLKKKTQILETELKINFAEMKGKKQEAENLEKTKPIE